MSLRLLSIQDVKQSISMPQAIDAMERAFMQLAQNQVELPLRTGLAIPEEQALTLTMPAYLRQDQTLGLKVVSIFPGNVAKHKPAINGFIMLLDEKTGEPKVLMDASYLTALRTGAVSGLATKYFAHPDSSHVAIIGSGAQALTQLEAVAAVRSIKRVSIWSRNHKNAQVLADKVLGQYDVVVCDSILSAVKNADIICTATSSTEPLFSLSDIQSHVHINAIGSHSSTMREINNDILKASVVIADQLEAVLAEAGEIISAVESKQLHKEAIIQIGDWLLTKKINYQKQLTVFKSVGLAIQDLSVAQEVYKNALGDNLGTLFALK